MLRHELYKTFANKVTIMFIVAVLIINVFQIWYVENGRKGYSSSSYNNLWNYMKAAAAESSDSENAWADVSVLLDEKIKESRGNYYEGKVFSKVKKELRFFLEYENYIKNIEETEARFKNLGSMIDRDSYVYRNAIKTAEVYRNLRTVKIEPAPSAGISVASHSDITDILALVVLLYIGITVWLKEKEEGALVLIRTAKNGRVRLTLCKIGVIAAACFIIVTALYVSNFIVAGILYEIGDLKRPIQSVAMYGTCSWNLTAGQFLIINIILKTAAYIWIVMFISMVCSKAQTSVGAFAAILIISAVSCFLYYSIPALSVFSPIKYLNPFGILKTENLFEGYISFDFFGYPVSYSICVVLLACLGYVVFSFFTIRFFLQYVIKGKMKLPAALDRIREYFIILRRNAEGHVSVAGHEIYRIFIYHKAIYVLIAALIFQIAGNQPYKPGYINLEEYYISQYLKKLSGPCTDEKEEYINAEEERLRKPADDSEREQREALSVVMGRYNYAKEADAYILYDEPFGYLTAQYSNRNDIMLATLFMLLLVLCMPGFFAPDLQNGMVKITGVTYKGRKKLVATRYEIGFILAAALYIIVYLPPFLQVIISYGVKAEAFNYPLNSIPHLERFDNVMSIGVYFIIIYTLRFVAGITGSLFIYKISCIIKNYIYTMFASFAVFITPALFALTNSAFIFVFYPYAMYGGNLFMQSFYAMVVSVLTAILLFIALAAVSYYKKRRV